MAKASPSIKKIIINIWPTFFSFSPSSSSCPERTFDYIIFSLALFRSCCKWPTIFGRVIVSTLALTTRSRRISWWSWWIDRRGSHESHKDQQEEEEKEEFFAKKFLFVYFLFLSFPRYKRSRGRWSVPSLLYITSNNVLSNEHTHTHWCKMREREEKCNKWPSFPRTGDRRKTVSVSSYFVLVDLVIPLCVCVIHLFYLLVSVFDEAQKRR